MKNLLKCLAFSVVTILLTTLGINAKAETISKTQDVLYVKNMDKSVEIAEKQLKQSMNDKTNKINITDMQVDRSLVSIKGILTLNNTEVPLNLEGSLKKIDTSNDILVGDLKDLTNNFEVIHFSINNSSKAFVSAFDGDYQKKSLNLYLQKNNSRDFIFIETGIPNNLNIKEIFSSIDTLDLFKPEQLMWFTKVVSPTSISESNTTTKNIQNNIISPAGSYYDTNSAQRFYSVKYTWLSRSMEELIWVDFSVMAGSTGYTNSIIKKSNGYVYDHTNSTVTSYNTVTDIREIKIQTGVTTGTLSNLYAGGQFTRGKTTLKGAISVSSGTPIPGVDISFGFTYKTTTINYPVYIGNSSAEWKMADSDYLLTNGDYININPYYVNNGSGSVVTTFRYRVYTVLDANTRYGTVTVSNNIFN